MNEEFSVICLDDELIKEYEDILKKYLDKYKNFDDDFDSVKFFDKVLDGEFNVFICSHNSNLELVGVTYLSDEGNVLNIYGISGKVASSSNFVNYLKKLVSFCKENGIKSINYKGRKGWKKILKMYNITEYTMYSFEV